MQYSHRNTSKLSTLDLKFKIPGGGGHGPSEASWSEGSLQMAISNRHWLLYVVPSVPHFGSNSLVQAFSHGSVQLDIKRNHDTSKICCNEVKKDHKNYQILKSWLNVVRLVILEDQIPLLRFMFYFSLFVLRQSRLVWKLVTCIFFLNLGSCLILDALQEHFWLAEITNKFW